MNSHSPKNSPMSDILAARVEHRISGYAAGCRGIVCALSGGADSVSMLFLLKTVLPPHDISLSACHVNHNLRGAESDRDEEFCRKLCQRLGIEFFSESVDVAALVRKTGASTEEAARELRYKALLSHVGADMLLATAHNADDNAETVLFNMIRGTGLRGLCGIPARRDSIIRPILDIRRAEVEKYLSELGETYVTDSTNLTDDYSRNRIRHILIPAAEGINSGAVDAIDRLAAIVTETEEYFSEVLSGVSGDLRRYPAAVRKRFISRLLDDNHIPADNRRINETDRCITAGNGKICVSDGVYLRVMNGELSLQKDEDIPDISVKIDTPLTGFTAELAEYDKKVTIICGKGEIFPPHDKVNKNLTNNVLDCGKIRGTVYLRNRREGDRIAFAGRGFHKSVRKYFNELKLTERERRTALFLEDSTGIIWSEYGGIAEGVRPDENTGDDRYILIKVSPE
ncbi:MAG: tRNA lysidine(34) synthetase TilS [Oscillospiraceae bacterium]|nr:tRNA lysidine(34) synthetase TilS [Oscillospiraceae bacterium]